MTIKSPCIRICALNEEAVCVGCGMSVRDLRVWRSVDDQEKEKIIRASRDRLRCLQMLRDEDLYNDDEN